VRIRFVKNPVEVRCEVADEGPGIPESIKPHLFTPCRSTRGGSGLGLAISRQLAHHLGGRLELEVSSATGCVFVLVLPRDLITGRSVVTSRDENQIET
jgi:signal transduction histidine kinase